MNRKTTYLIPVFVAVFALMFASVPSGAMAQSDYAASDYMGQKKSPMHKVIIVEDFVGTIEVTQDADKKALKDQFTVTLSEAASGLDVTSGKLGVVENQEGTKYFAWILKSIDKDTESETATVTIHIVDAANSANTTSLTQEMQSPKKGNMMNHQNNQGARQSSQNLSQVSGDPEYDALKTEFMEKLSELREARQNDPSDRDTLKELRDELHDLRQQLGEFYSQ